MSNSVMPTKPLIVIPARLAATRLPMKPLADIHGEAMIVHVWRRAIESGIGPAIVATDDKAIAAAIRQAGGSAILTRSDHASGSDRIAEALAHYDPSAQYDVIVNIQGDLPTIDPESVRAAILPLRDAEVDLATICAVITNAEERDNPNVVKLVGTRMSEARLRALYFTRATAPYGAGPLYHHIGLYAYRRSVLERFVALPPSELEQRERLEQLRALEAGFRIDAMIVDAVPLGVDTPEDLERARAILKKTV
jgi:3-deoxy-manno-octulosonate cytidylyltransferase (CMP-KDO synthetase)